MATDEFGVIASGITVVFTEYGKALREVWRANCEHDFTCCKNYCLKPIFSKISGVNHM